jgi:hypothetical protein
MLREHEKVHRQAGPLGVPKKLHEPALHPSGIQGPENVKYAQRSMDHEAGHDCRSLQEAAASPITCAYSDASTGIA